MVQIILEQGLRLFLIRIDEGPGNLFFQNLQILLVKGVLQIFEILFSSVVREIRFPDHADNRLSDINGADTVSRHVVRKGIVQSLHNEAGRDTRHPLPLGGFSEFVDVNLFRSSLLHHLFTVVKLELGHQVTLIGRLQSGKDGKHRRDLKSVGSHMGAKIGVADNFLVNFNFLRKS